MINYIKAFIIMLKAHWKQRDKGNHLYIFHPIRVSRKCKSKSAKLVALLHDVIEDNPNYSIGDFDFLNEEEKNALELLTHNEDVAYFEYINEIKNDEIARDVKLSDLKDNSNLKRLSNITDKDLKRVEKYKLAENILLSEQ
ncbi:GTP pyrophosphokinase [Anaerococcus sp. Marseille-P3625]|uniref:GTP pyrophosphokinase n=1 Tax=Anaerococcus sp. Marseille-P3625 TaxID=1977277 RepID=UPI000C07FE6F|nr:GTP pyrophosphokinase [Anaerococcus sp. Marseille-P3625]